MFSFVSFLIHFTWSHSTLSSHGLGSQNVVQVLPVSFWFWNVSLHLRRCLTTSERKSMNCFLRVFLALRMAVRALCMFRAAGFIIQAQLFLLLKGFWEQEGKLLQHMEWFMDSLHAWNRLRMASDDETGCERTLDSSIDILTGWRGNSLVSFRNTCVCVLWMQSPFLG